MQVISGKICDWQVVIGLEVHAQINSKTKLFSCGSCSFDAEPNSCVNFFDAAMPGTLPVLNFSCVEKAIKAGLGLFGKINLRSVFERKHYFYPDLPHGYQITQYAHPIITGGKACIKDQDGSEKIIRINHIHMEQDAGKSIHDLSPNKTYIDLNRAGVPLMEIVTEPDIRSSFEACAFVNKLKLILQYVGASNANMEKGELRCDANVSVRKVGETEFGSRCEIKNLNSTKSLMQAIDYEAKRQVDVIESGGSIDVQTRLFDTKSLKTKAMRSKEDATDYRYFPDPDLLPLVLQQEYVEQIESKMPELPDAKENRYKKDLGLNQYEIDIIVSSIDIARYFDSIIQSAHDQKDRCIDAKFAFKWLTVELFGALGKSGIDFKDCPIDAQNFKDLMHLMLDQTISEKIGKSVLQQMISSGKKPNDIVKEQGLVQVTDKALINSVVSEVLDENKLKLEEYLSGKERLFGFFVGQIMQKTKGKANPRIVNDILKSNIEKRKSGD